MERHGKMMDDDDDDSENTVYFVSSYTQFMDSPMGEPSNPCHCQHVKAVPTFSQKWMLN